MNFRTFADLTKLGITIFVVLSGLAGYALSFSIEAPFDKAHLFYFIAGLFFLSSCSLCLNQVQEYQTDKLMNRTAKRPIASGKISPRTGLLIAIAMLLAGSFFLYRTSLFSLALGLLTIVLYNGFYTYWWKRKWIFAAIPGAIPGTLPVTMGFVANSDEVFRIDSVYLFAVLFAWQMPHFWALAMKYQEDYSKIGVPSLPVAIGKHRAFWHIGLWTFAYVIIALASPWMVHSSWAYVVLVLPVTAKVIIEFWKYFKSDGEENWFGFFIWINLSLLAFLYAPVIDKWNFVFTNSN